MAQRYYNPFANINLIHPVEQRDFYNKYCQTGSRQRADFCPFPRKVDFWFAGLSVATRLELKPMDLSKQKTTIIIEGAIFDRDSWRVQAVTLIAFAIEDSVEVVGNPHGIMAIANGLAAVGVPHLVEMLSDGNLEPIWNLSDALDEILRQ